MMNMEIETLIELMAISSDLHREVGKFLNFQLHNIFKWLRPRLGTK